MNLRIKQLEMQLIESINNSGVDIATVSLILEKLLNESNAMLHQIISQEQMAQEELVAQEEDVKENDNKNIVEEIKEESL